MPGNLEVCATLHGIRFVLIRGPIDDADVDVAVETAATDGARGVLLFAPAVLRPPPPTSAQLTRLFRARGIRGVPTAIVSESRAFRLVLKILGWLGTPMRAFSRDELSEALTFLGVSDELKPELMMRARELVESLAAPSTPS